MTRQEENVFGGLKPEVKGWIIKGSVIFTLLIVGCFGNPLVCVGSGHRGVVKTYGAVSDRILNEGVNIIMPFAQSVEKLDVRLQKKEVSSEAPSKDLQEIKTVIALNYHLMPTAVNKLYQEIGISYEDTLITPIVLETMKFVSSQYTATELITKREEVSSKIQNHLKDKLTKYYMIVDEINIKSFDFSPAFAKSIEEKQTAEQNALTEQNNTKKILALKDQKIAEAQGEAESLRLRANQITPLMVEMERIKKWDGTVPTYIGGGRENFLMQITGNK